MKQELSQESLEQFPLATAALPLGWKLALLYDIAEDIAPGFASGEHDSEGRGQPHLRPMNIDRNGQVDLSVVKSVPPNSGRVLIPGDVLFNNTNSPELVGKTALIGAAENGFAFSNHMTRIRVEEELSSSYIAHYLHFLWMSGYMKYRCTNHVNQASISSKTLAETVPLIVPPAIEQIRIVEKLEELLSDLDAGVAELKAAQRKLAQYRQSLLKAAVEGALTADWRAARAQSGEPQESGADLLQRILTERRTRWESRQLAKFAERGKIPPKDWRSKNPIIASPPNAGSHPLPQEWTWSSLGQCFHIAVGATPSRKDPSYWMGSIPWVSSGEVRFARITDTKERITEEGMRNTSTSINPEGSVLLGMIGEGKTRGQVAILGIEAANNQNCAAIWVSETQIPSEYIYYWLWSRYDETRRDSSGNNQPALNKSIVKAIPFPLPPLEELEEIVGRVDSALHQTAQQEIAIVYALKQSAAQRKNILKAAFAGHLVPQDPSDEPASVLLDRIRAERVSGNAKRLVKNERKPKEKA